ncbi:MAG: DUF4372 domain-containing protein [Bryobacterales bacterium]|nr:DUF4372 domain-containing protein [Bryobacterales bacterium]
MNRVSSIFSQMLKLVPATLFDRAVCKYRGERPARGFRSWDPFAAIDKQRWQVELFFKALKQNLRIKSFVGTSANALTTQIWTALIALLLVRFLQLKSKLNWHPSRFLALLRQQLFVYRDLWLFLDHPFEGPPGANPAEESPSPLLMGLFEAAPRPQTEPESSLTSAPQSIAAGVPAMEGC